MKHKIEYSFDDEIVRKFCYEIENKTIKIYFHGYYDLCQNSFVNKKTVWIIKDWSNAKSKLSSDAKFDKLESHLSIISMVLSLEFDGTYLLLTTIMLNNRYIDLLFEKPILKLL